MSRIVYIIVFALFLLLGSCSSSRRLTSYIQQGHISNIVLSKDDETDLNDSDSMNKNELGKESSQKSIGDKRKDGENYEGETSDLESNEPIIMNAIRDTETGEMIATDKISASRVVARFNNVAERGGRVNISFDLIVPSQLLGEELQLRYFPKMEIQSDTLNMNAIYIRGKSYDDKVIRGHERYNKFIASILTDTLDYLLLDQLEIFISRNYPAIYAMKRDSSIVPAPMAESFFGVSQRTALEHYSKTLRSSMNRWRIKNKDRMRRKYIKEINQTGLYLDTLLESTNADFVYTYEYSFKTRPNLRKVNVFMDGSIHKYGETLLELPRTENITYYISSLSSMADTSVRYKTQILQRRVQDNTIALIDFAQGKYALDTCLNQNAMELERVYRCISDVLDRDMLELDSLIITASCSPEGSYKQNEQLSINRSKAVRDHIQDVWGEYLSSFNVNEKIKLSSMPENWEKLEKMVIHDENLSAQAKDKILYLIATEDNLDKRERKIASLEAYRYLREKIYPSLRTVKFDFHLHRKTMQKDTIHTTVVDEQYMEGLAALENLDYSRAVEILRPYKDFNSALAYLASDYNHSALEILEHLPQNKAEVLYLKAIVYARLGRKRDAKESLNKAIEYNSMFKHRANLDPELSNLVVRD